jgi:predicted RNA-binding protein with PUA-like domain
MNHWLLKSEPGTYGWHDLVKDKRTRWDGVRNPQATQNLRAMKTGDRAFFYHSGEERAIVGLCEIVKPFYPDPADKSGRFGMVDVAVLEPLKKPVSLQQIKAEPRLADFALVRQGRLSVVPVSKEQWQLIAGLGGVKP